MLILHLTASLAADLLVMASSVVSFAYLLADRSLKSKIYRPAMPSIQVLDNVGIKLLSSGFILMTVGIAAGSIMAYQSWGPRWYLDARQIWSTATWLVFAFVLIARATVGWRGKQAAVVTLIGTSLVVTGLIVLNYGIWTHHGV